MLGPRVNIQLLMEGIGIQARKDYLEATEALEKGRDSIHYLMCDAVKSEVENWFYIMFDYEQAEAQVEELRDYRQAKSKGKQVKILADLNACKKEDIAKVLMKR